MALGCGAGVAGLLSLKCGDSVGCQDDAKDGVGDGNGGCGGGGDGGDEEGDGETWGIDGGGKGDRDSGVGFLGRCGIGASRVGGASYTEPSATSFSRNS